MVFPPSSITTERISMAADRPIIGVDERVPVAKAIPLGIQHFMSMFGSTVLVPFLTGLSPSLAIMCSGIGTILYLLVTRGKIPSYLGSSFAFITPIAMVASSQGVGAVGGALIVTGLVYVAVAGIIKVAGTGWLDFILPAPVVAPVIVVIGLGLSATAVKMAFFNGGYDSGAPFNYEGFAVAALTLAVSVVFSTCFKGFWSTIPVLIGVLVGYAASCMLGLVDFQPIAEAAWIGLPTLTAPTFDLGAIILIAPVAIVIIIEHIGHLLVVGEVVGKNYNDMLPRSLLGDGLSTMVSGFLGGTPTTTYAENIGVMSATRVYSTQIFWYAGGIAFIVGDHQFHSHLGHGRRKPAVVWPDRLQRLAHAGFQPRRLQQGAQPHAGFCHLGCGRRHGNRRHQNPRGSLRDSRHGHKRHRGRDFEPLPAERYRGR